MKRLHEDRKKTPPTGSDASGLQPVLLTAAVSVEEAQNISGRLLRYDVRCSITENFEIYVDERQLRRAIQVLRELEGGEAELDETALTIAALQAHAEEPQSNGGYRVFLLMLAIFAVVFAVMAFRQFF